MLWRNHYDWIQKEQIMDEKWRADEEAGFGEGAEEGDVREEETEEEQSENEEIE